MIRRRHPARRLRRPCLEVLEPRTLLTGLVEYLGGSLIPNVNVSTIYYGSQWASTYTQNPYPISAYPAQMDAYFNKITDSTWMDILNQYSATGNETTPPIQYTIGHGSFGMEDLTNPSLPTGTGNTVTDADIQNMIQGEISAGHVPAVDQNQLYIVFTPPEETISLSANGVYFGASWVNFTAYHFDFRYTTTDPTDPNAGKFVSYAVIALPPTMADAVVKGGVTGIPPANDPVLDQLTKDSSHELAESVTDPVNGLGWNVDSHVGINGNDRFGAEIADLPFFLGDDVWKDLHGYAVAQLYSNSASSSVIEVDKPISIKSITSSTSAGQTTVTVTLHDTDNTYRMSGALSDFTPTFTWGDGITTTTDITGSTLGGGDFQFTATHDYSISQPSFSVTVDDVGGATTTSSQTLDLHTAVTFSGLQSQTISYGQELAVSGSLVAASSFPASETISITIGAATGSVAINPDGSFSGTVDTSALGASSTAYTITYGYAGDATNQPQTDSSTTLTVDQATLTVTADAAPATSAADAFFKTYDGKPFTGFTARYDGFVNSQGPGVLGGTLAFSGPGTTAIDQGSYAVAPVGLTSVNYHIVFDPGTLNINALPVSLSGSRNYDGTTNAASPILAVSNAIAGDTVSVASGSGALAGKDVGTWSLTSLGSLALGNNAKGDYTLTGATGSVTINAAPLDITANGDSKTYGQIKTYGAGSTAFTTGAGQLQNNETIGSVTITDTNGGGLATAAAGGTYALTPSAATGGTFSISNYKVTYHAGTLTVNPSATTTSLSFNPAVPGQSVTFTAVIAPVAPGGGTPTGTVTFTSGSTTSGPVPVVGGQASWTTSFSTAGSSAITATYKNQDGNYTGSSDSKIQTVLGPGVYANYGTTLYIVGGSTTSDNASLTPAGLKSDGTTGLAISAKLNGTSYSTAYTQTFTAIVFAGYGGNETLTLASTLALTATITAGDGNDTIQLGACNSTLTLGNGNDTVTGGGSNNTVTLGNGNNTVTVGNGNDTILLGNGSNVVVEGNGTDKMTVGNGNNFLVGGLGSHTLTAGNGINILIDGSATVVKPSDSFRSILNDWVANSTASNQSKIRARFTVSYNTKYANTLTAGTGVDWFFYIYAMTTSNKKKTDFLN